MRKFVELTRRKSDDKIMINMNHITSIRPANDGDGGTAIALIDCDNCFLVEEDYDAIRAFLISCDLL